MTSAELKAAGHEAHREAAYFALVASGLLSLLAVASVAAGWTLVGVHGWIWFVLSVPELLLAVAFLLKVPHRFDAYFLYFVVVGNLGGLGLVLASLLTEASSKLTGGQLLLTGAVVWLTNVIAFGLLYWNLDAGGPMERAQGSRERPDLKKPDFWFPQDDNDRLAQTKWRPRLSDYTYVALTNGIAFSPTDAMPLTRGAKTLMGLEALISVGAVLLVAARAVNVLGA